jgi:hypothetical protein
MNRRTLLQLLLAAPFVFPEFSQAATIKDTPVTLMVNRLDKALFRPGLKTGSMQAGEVMLHPSVCLALDVSRLQVNPYWKKATESEKAAWPLDVGMYFPSPTSDPRNYGRSGNVVVPIFRINSNPDIERRLAYIIDPGVPYETEVFPTIDDDIPCVGTRPVFGSSAVDLYR